MAAASTAAVATTTFGDAFRQTAFGPGPGGNVLVVLSLRGGIDGLGLVVPHGDPAYYTARPTIALPKASLVATDAMFGLHPQMAPLTWLWDAGELAAVHAVGLPVPNRSHFSAMEEIEDADPGSSVRAGLDQPDDRARTAPTSPSEAVQLGTSVVPTELYGAAPTLAAGRLSDISLVGADAERLGAAPPHRARPDVGGAEHARAGRRLRLGHPHRRPARPDRRGGLRADRGRDLPDAGRPPTSPTPSRTPPS